MIASLKILVRLGECTVYCILGAAIVGKVDTEVEKLEFVVCFDSIMNSILGSMVLMCVENVSTSYSCICIYVSPT